MARRRLVANAAQISFDQENDLLAGMNPEQAEAVQHIDGPLGVFAGAGSGKTRVLVHRVAHLIRSGVPANRILAVTFSKKAADEMAQRAADLGCGEARFGTWHSLALEILRKDETEQSRWEIDDGNRAKYVMKEILGFRRLNWAADLGQVLSFVGFCKSQLWLPDDPRTVEYAKRMFQGRDVSRAVQAYCEYQSDLEAKSLLTFDDMLLLAWQHLSVEENRARWAARWDYLLQDEAQDANPAQNVIAEMLARDHRNYMIVGDPAQSIYGWRGSSPSALKDFETKWAAKIVTMHRNYRCGSTIIDAANGVIRPSPDRLPRDLVAEGGWQGRVTYARVADLDEEARTVVEACMANHASTGHWTGNTILFRTNAQSRAFEEELLGQKIPYVVVGGTCFYERKEVKDLLAYLRAAVEGDWQSARRCLNAPFRFLGSAFADELEHHWAGGQDPERAVSAACQRKGIQSRQRAGALEWAGIMSEIARQEALDADDADDADKFGSVGELVQWLIETTNFAEWLRKDEGEESLESSHIANIKELVRVAERFASVSALLSFVDTIIRDSKKAAKDGKADRVLLMSIHRSKGLEWDNVFVSGASEKILPHPRGDEAEERRLFYVAVTRARQTCTITSPASIALKSGVTEVAPSRFLRDAGIVG